MDAAQILFASAPDNGHAFVERWRGIRPSFWCVLAHTDTCLVPGISSAGVTEELRPYTPAADAEVIVLGAPQCLPRLPSNPMGAPGPAGITRAALQLAGLDVNLAGAGLRVWPRTPVLRLSELAGARIDQPGPAVADACDLFALGCRLGRQAAANAPWLVIGESVPGGTTTALAVLLALGYAAEGRVSGSMPGNAHLLKSRVARAAVRKLGGEEGGHGVVDPLTVISLVGDPMQPVVAGMALSAIEAGRDVLLAGGSQMLAVAALLRALAGESVLRRLAIGTTRWVALDPSADVRGLARDIDPELPLLAANLDFSMSRHTELSMYEQFVVKEGVGAGGACIAALEMTGASSARLQAEIDAVYDELLGRLTPSDTADSGRR